MPTWMCCQAPSPDGRYLCTERVPAGQVTHAGDHVAGGRAEGEPDSVIATWPQAAGPYEHRGAYTAAAPVLPMPDLVTYICVDCDPPREFQHREPFEAHGLYLDHMTEHDTEDGEAADAYADALDHYAEEVPD